MNEPNPPAAPRLLLRVPAGDIERVVISPDGALLTAATGSDLIAWRGHSSSEVTFAQVSTQTGQTVRVPYRVRTGARTGVSSLAPGSPGQYLSLIHI